MMVIETSSLHRTKAYLSIDSTVSGTITDVIISLSINELELILFAELGIAISFFVSLYHKTIPFKILKPFSCGRLLKAGEPKKESPFISVVDLGIVNELIFVLKNAHVPTLLVPSGSIISPSN